MIGSRTFTGLCRARDLLRDVGDEAPRIADVAKAAGLSPSHFIRQFEALFGETPHQFRMRSRIEHAQQLLAAGRHSVTDVCLEVGFSSLGSFSGLFARRVGVAPSVYRRQRRLTQQVPGMPPPLLPGCLSLLAQLPPQTAIFEKHPGRGLAHTR